MTARRAPRVAPAFDLDLFDSRSPFARILAEGLAATPAPAPALVVVPDIVPAPPAPAAPTPLPRPRDFAAPIERIQRGEHLVIRSADDRYQHYWAYERATTFFYGATLDGDPAWGRIDTRRSSRTLSTGASIDWGMKVAAEARAVIRDLCPEARLAHGETAPSSGVYDGPNYICLMTDPERRYRAALERIAAEAARAAALVGRPA